MASLQISEIFYSLQGESNTVGLPTVFVRLTGCPLRCSYCDTAYAFRGGEEMNLDAVLERIASFGCKHITVTGGEPLAQEPCLELLTSLCDAGYLVSLETSGVLDLSEVDSRVTKVMDIKTPGSREAEKNLFSNFAHLSRSDQIKFVICDEADYIWSRDIIQQKSLESVAEILMLPAYGEQNPTDLAEWILGDRLPVRFQMQLHKQLWGDAKGK
jgi:7-carboxy-7-deazaguanine synthase